MEKSIIKNKKKANLGKEFEDEISLANLYYRKKGIAVIYKRPTPIKIVKMRRNVITYAFFSSQSKTDFNGVFNGYYLDFEAKSTNLKRLPKRNIREQQLEHLDEIIKNGGIGFFLIYFKTCKKVFFLDAEFVIKFFEDENKKSIPFCEIEKNGFLIEEEKKEKIKINFIEAVKKFLKKKKKLKGSRRKKERS